MWLPPSNDSDIDYPAYDLPTIVHPTRNQAEHLTVYNGGGKGRISHQLDASNSSSLSNRHSEAARITFEDFVPVNAGGGPSQASGIGEKSAIRGNEIIDIDDHASAEAKPSVPTVVYPVRSKLHDGELRSVRSDKKRFDKHGWQQPRKVHDGSLTTKRVKGGASAVYRNHGGSIAAASVSV